MPGPVRTRNERLIVADPLSASEGRQRDRVAVFCVGKGLAPLVEGDVRRWARPLQKEEKVNFEMRLAEPGLERRCDVSGCANTGGTREFRCGVGLVLCDTHLCAQRVGSSFDGADWAADGHCVRCWGEVAACDSWLLSSGHRACAGCAAGIAEELRRVEDRPALRCLGCNCLLQRPLRHGLDGRARCSSCSRKLVSADAQ